MLPGREHLDQRPPLVQDVAAPPTPRARRLRIEPSDLLLEIISIVIAIVLATSVGQAVEHVRDVARTRDALARVRQEVVANRAQLAQVTGLHRRVQSSIERLAAHRGAERVDFDAFLGAFTSAAPRGFNPFFGEDTAWQLARTSAALGDAPYPLRATLQRAYGEQQGVRDLDERVLAGILTAPTSDRPNYYYVAVAMTFTLTDIVYAERRLMRDYDDAVHALDAAGIR